MYARNILGLLYPQKPIMDAGRAILGAPVRHVFMIGTIWYLKEKCGCKEPGILEVGSWCGASALSWVQGLKAYCRGRGSLTCVDAWTPFFHDTPDQGADYAKEMDALLQSDVAYEIFCHNMRTVPDSVATQHVRGRSENVLPQLRDQCYDVVFVDANHAYASVHRDILDSLRLVREGGVICGDDLNLQLHECDEAFTRLNSDRDMVTGPSHGRNYHPGVTLAVAEVFGRVSSWGGYWAMQKHGDSWDRFTLKGMPVLYPEHFPVEELARARSHFADIKDCI